MTDASETCPSCQAPMREGAAVCMSCGFNRVLNRPVELKNPVFPVRPRGYRPVRRGKSQSGWLGNLLTFALVLGAAVWGTLRVMEQVNRNAVYKVIQEDLDTLRARSRLTPLDLPELYGRIEHFPGFLAEDPKPEVLEARDQALAEVLRVYPRHDAAMAALPQLLTLPVGAVKCREVVRDLLSEHRTASWMVETLATVDPKGRDLLVEALALRFPLNLDDRADILALCSAGSREARILGIRGLIMEKLLVGLVGRFRLEVEGSWQSMQWSEERSTFEVNSESLQYRTPEPVLQVSRDASGLRLDFAGATTVLDLDGLQRTEIRQPARTLPGLPARLAGGELVLRRPDASWVLSLEDVPEFEAGKVFVLGDAKRKVTRQQRYTKITYNRFGGIVGQEDLTLAWDGTDGVANLLLRLQRE